MPKKRNNPKTKIAHIVSTYPPYKGGMGNSAHTFASGLAKLNKNHIEVFTPRFNKNSQIFLEKKNYLKIHYLAPLIKIGNGAMLPQLLWRLRKFQIAHLHYPFFGTAEIVLLAKLINPQLKLILHYHMDSRASGMKGWIFSLYNKTILPILARLSSHVTCASLDYIEHSSLRNYYHKNPNKFSEIPFGVNVEKFSPQNIKPESDIRECRLQDKIHSKTSQILFVGNLDSSYHDKGLDVLLAAVRNILDQSKSVHRSSENQNSGGSLKLNIIGSGNREKEFKQIAKNFKIEKNVAFLGKVSENDLIKNIQNCETLILPSKTRSEAFGIVLIEAMSCAKPVIASNLPGVRSVFIDGQTGFLVEANNQKDLIDKILKIINNPEKSKIMGQAARKLVLEKYNQEKIIQKLNQVYENFVTTQLLQ